MADYEQAIKGTLQHIFGNNLEWNGCFFHFGQAINRKIQAIGLITEYKDRANPFSIMVRKMRTLACLNS